MGRGDERGQSELIGVLLIFAIIVALVGFNQAFLVPIANEDIEAKHGQTVQDDMVELRSGIVEAAGSNTQQSVSVQLGVDFPPHLLAINPAPASGTLQTDPPEGNEGNLTVEGANFSIRELCGVGEQGENVSTTFVTYDANYNRYDMRGPIAVENSVTHRAGGALLDSNQVIVKGDQIRIIRVVGEYQSSGTKTRSIDLYPSRTNVTNTSDDFNLTLPTQVSADTWNETLLENEGVVENVTGSGDNVTIELDASDDLSVKCTTVGIDEQPDVEVNPPQEVELVSDITINPIGSDALELTNVEAGNNPDYNLTFTNNRNNELTLNRTRVLYVLGPGETTGSEVSFFADYPDHETVLTIGEGFKNVAQVEWSSGGEESIQLDGFNQHNSGVAIELELVEENTGEQVRFIYFASAESN